MDEATFNITAEQFTGNMPGWGDDVEGVGDATRTNALYSENRATAAQSSADAAVVTLGQVNAAAAGAFAAANYKGDWSTLTGSLNPPATVTHQGRLWYLKQALANVTTQPPALGSAYWGEVSRNDFIVMPAPAGSTSAADRCLYRMSSGTSVLVLPAAPWHGMVVAAVNVSGTLTPTIQRNGKTICGDAEDYVMNVLGWQIVLQYDSGSGDWLTVSGVTAFTPYATSQPFNQANNWNAKQAFLAGVSPSGAVSMNVASLAANTYVDLPVLTAVPHEGGAVMLFVSIRDGNAAYHRLNGVIVTQLNFWKASGTSVANAVPLVNHDGSDSVVLSVRQKTTSNNGGQATLQIAVSAAISPRSGATDLTVSAKFFLMT
ncbi:hypothetical protein [Comamonas humi]